jgi:hypothetical protein
MLTNRRFYEEKLSQRRLFQMYLFEGRFFSTGIF